MKSKKTNNNKKVVAIVASLFAVAAVVGTSVTVAKVIQNNNATNSEKTNTNESSKITFEYYFDDKLDDQKTSSVEIKNGNQYLGAAYIKEYVGYGYDHISGASTWYNIASGDNVVRIYYVKDKVTFKVTFEYYKDGTLDPNLTEVLPFAKDVQFTGLNFQKVISGYKYDHLNGIATGTNTVTSDMTGKFYYLTSESGNYNYSLHIYRSDDGITGTYSDIGVNNYGFTTIQDLKSLSSFFVGQNSIYSSYTFNDSKSSLVKNTAKLYYYKNPDPVVTPPTINYTLNFIIYTSINGVNGTYTEFSAGNTTSTSAWTAASANSYVGTTYSSTLSSYTYNKEKEKITNAGTVYTYEAYYYKGTETPVTPVETYTLNYTVKTSSSGETGTYLTYVSNTATSYSTWGLAGAKAQALNDHPELNNFTFYDSKSTMTVNGDVYDCVLYFYKNTTVTTQMYDLDYNVYYAPNGVNGTYTKLHTGTASSESVWGIAGAKSQALYTFSELSNYTYNDSKSTMTVNGDTYTADLYFYTLLVDIAYTTKIYVAHNGKDGAYVLANTYTFNGTNLSSTSDIFTLAQEGYTDYQTLTLNADKSSISQSQKICNLYAYEGTTQTRSVTIRQLCRDTVGGTAISKATPTVVLVVGNTYYRAALSAMVTTPTGYSYDADANENPSTGEGEVGYTVTSDTSGQQVDIYYIKS